MAGSKRLAAAIKRFRESQNIILIADSWQQMIEFSLKIREELGPDALYTEAPNRFSMVLTRAIAKNTLRVQCCITWRQYRRLVLENDYYILQNNSTVELIKKWRERMSHDRGCGCGREPYEYHECTDATCRRGIEARRAREQMAVKLCPSCHKDANLSGTCQRTPCPMRQKVMSEQMAEVQRLFFKTTAVMTPLALQVLLRAYYLAEYDFNREYGRSEAHAAAIDRMIGLKDPLIQLSSDKKFIRSTPRGRAYIEAVLNVPLPELHTEWRVPK